MERIDYIKTRMPYVIISVACASLSMFIALGTSRKTAAHEKEIELEYLSKKLDTLTDSIPNIIEKISTEAYDAGFLHGQDIGFTKGLNKSKENEPRGQD